MHIDGNTRGLKSSQVRRLERLTRRRVPAERVVSHELARELTEISFEIGRQVGVLIDRRGEVTHVMCGTAKSIELPDWGRLRAGLGRLRGLRCIHTHIRDEGLDRDDLTDLALLRLDAMVAITMDERGLPKLAHVGSLRPVTNGGDPVELLAPTAPANLDLDFPAWIRDIEDELGRLDRTRKIGSSEGAILVSVSAGRSADELEAHVAELVELARSAGVEVVDTVTQQRSRLDPRYVMGVGKLQELVIHALQSGVDLVIFDQSLSPTQARNLAQRLDLRVIDRTQLILDIFAQHATSRDGKLQVELAQLRYRMPRLAQRADVSLSRLAGGIGGRGPGETKLEVDRRRVRERVARLERELKKLRDQRQSRRRQRARRGIPVLSIVGYTNAGKSTLLKALTNTEAHVANALFATLDPASRRLRFPRDREVIITDTVGFIRDLPPELVTAFRATLEELSDADLLLHVVDVATPDWERRIATVRQVLDEIGISKAPELLVFNQIDRLPASEAKALLENRDGVAISALKRIGLQDLLSDAEELLWAEVDHPPEDKRERKRIPPLAADGTQ
ncbi:MAG: GTPase HflX [Deltaproteobacteria bacterium]|nr:GTPase HflX [Deltaproteobacteria bacterium]MBW2541364.1 GTPase HflX [Deltaproteobacteria bacterium]